MKTNLFLFAVILVGGWYLFHMPPSSPAPVAAPAPPPAARVSRNISQSYQSPLNDSASAVGTNSGSHSGYPANGLDKSSSLTLGTGNPVRNGSSAQPSSTTGLRTDGLGANNGEPTLNIQQRANSIRDAAKGE